MGKLVSPPQRITVGDEDFDGAIYLGEPDYFQTQLERLNTMSRRDVQDSVSRWLGDGETPVGLVHKGCGAVTEPRMTCPECGEPMDAHDSEARLSLGFSEERQRAGKQT